MKFVTDKDVQNAVDTYSAVIHTLPKATRGRVVAEEKKKAVISALIMKSDLKTAAEREAWAYSQPEYMTYLTELGSAIEMETEIKLSQKWADMVIDVYRTESANQRRG